jgi:hypothetical protein
MRAHDPLPSVAFGVAFSRNASDVPVGILSGSIFFWFIE